MQCALRNLSSIPSVLWALLGGSGMKENADLHASIYSFVHAYILCKLNSYFSFSVG